ncbi:MAG: arylesterase, partial [Pseudomonadales bacterium]|nr:arylesterase [Pseudomonadales bacterium]
GYIVIWMGLYIGAVTTAAIAEAEPGSAQVNKPENTLLIVGDSISAGYGIPVDYGWVELLEQRLVQQGIPWKVVNASISGETTKGALDRFPALVKRHSPKVVVIELGGNDGLRGYPVKEMTANFEAMIQMSQEIGAKTILAGMRLPPNYGGRYAEPFFQQYASIAEKYQTGLVPFFLDGVAGHPDMMQGDGIHPNEPAQSILLEHVWKPLKPMLAH